jgi:hypothetical protein
MLDGAKGESYEGQMQGRQRHGYGTLTYRDGSTYEGFWRLDRRNGHGELQTRLSSVHCAHLIYMTSYEIIYLSTGC